MALEPLPGFRAFPTHHCVTGSLRHLYQLMGTDVSEELLLGLGAGVGFVYWHQKGQLPFLGGRANVGRPGEDGMECRAGRRTGVGVTRHTTSSARRARDQLVADLSSGIPAMLQVDMGLLPYFDFPPDYHFGGHVVAAVGYDAGTGTVLVCDRDTEPHPVPLPDLAAARGSGFQPFPPRNGWWEFDFGGQRAPHPQEVRDAIVEAATGMLEPPISNLGVRGIRKAAGLIPRWPRQLAGGALPGACFNGYIMLSAVGGTGGGMFRYMYARFLAEAAELTGQPALHDIGERMRATGDRWEEVATLFDKAHREGDPSATLSDIESVMSAIADEEEGLWAELLDAARA